MCQVQHWPREPIKPAGHIFLFNSTRDVRLGARYKEVGRSHDVNGMEYGTLVLGSRAVVYSIQFFSRMRAREST